jgi:hypothetical protein
VVLAPGAERSGRSRRLIAAFLAAMVAAAAAPALAAVYHVEYSTSTATVTGPSVSLGAGDAGSTAVSAVAADAATSTTDAGLTYYQSANAATGALSIDQSGTSTGNSLSLSVPLSATQASELIYVVAEMPYGTSVSRVTDTFSDSFIHRQTASSTKVTVEAWYGSTGARSGSDTVTVTFSARANVAILVFTVKGANTASPFDPDVGTAPTSSGTGGTASVSITTAYPNDILIGAVAVDGQNPTTAGTGFTLIKSAHGGPGSGTVAGDYKVVTTTQTGAAVSFTLGSPPPPTDWAIIADAIVEAVPAATADTSLASPATSGSQVLTATTSAYLWSAAYSSGETLYPGVWTADLWASATASGTLLVSAYAVDSSNNIVATLLTTGSTVTVGTSKGESKTTFSMAGGTVPANGRIMVVVTAPAGGPASFTLYWGSGELTNFQTPPKYDYVLTISTPAGTSWNVNLAVASSSGIARLTNATVWLKVPDSPPYTVFSQQIALLSGAFTKSAGSSVSLAASTTMYAYLYVTASSVGTSTIVLTLRVQPSSTTPYSLYTVVLTVN